MLKNYLTVSLEAQSACPKDSTKTIKDQPVERRGLPRAEGHGKVLTSVLDEGNLFHGLKMPHPSWPLGDCVLCRVLMATTAAHPSVGAKAA